MFFPPVPCSIICFAASQQGNQGEREPKNRQAISVLAGRAASGESTSAVKPNVRNSAAPGTR